MSKRKTLPLATTLMVRDHCLCLHIQRAARAVARRFDTALRPLRLTSGQFSLLMSLNRSVPPTLGMVSSVLAMDRTTLTANLKPLQRRGLLRVSVDQADKRTRRAALTATGHALLIAAMPVWQKTNADVEKFLGRSRADELRAELRRLSQADEAVAASEPRS